MKIDALEVLKDRRAIRAYKADQIKDEELNAVLEAGTFAPTGAGTQGVRIVAVQSPEYVARVDALNAKVIGKDGDRQDIDDGIDGTHFVEMDFFYGHAVSLCLGFGDDTENLLRGFKGAGRDCSCICCAVQNLVNLGQVPMFVMMMMTFMTFFRLSSIVFRLTMLYIPFFVRMHVVCVVVMDMYRKRNPCNAVTL